MWQENITEPDPDKNFMSKAGNFLPAFLHNFFDSAYAESIRFRKAGRCYMIKGVNKKVIEINRPDSAYFERAVLYLKPDVKEVPLQAAQMETLDYFRPEPKSAKMHGCFLFLLGMAVSAGVFGLWMYFCP